MIEYPHYESLHRYCRDANPLKETGDSLNVQYKPEHRNSHLTVPLFDFSFCFTLPSPRKERIIAVRDSLGRIISSRPPEPAFALVGGGVPRN